MTTRSAVMLAVFCWSAIARASDDVTVAIERGREPQALTFNAAARSKKTVFDPQSGAPRRVRGVPLSEIVQRSKLSRSDDAAIFHFINGMQVLVDLKGTEARDLFIAFEDGDLMGKYTAIADGPLVLLATRAQTFSIWKYANQLVSIRFVNAKTYEAELAQPSRQLPSHPGWKLYAKHCRSCHGIGGQGAKRGPDFIGDLEAYRRVPPLAATEVGDPPSLHEKVSGAVRGEMPSLSHVPKAEIIELWRWLHSVHKGATK